MKSYQDPSISYMKGGTEEGTRVPTWKMPIPYDLHKKQKRGIIESKGPNYYYPGIPYSGADRVSDYFKASYSPISITSVSSKIVGNRIDWMFPVNDKFDLKASISLPEGNSEPEISYDFSPTDEAWYSVGYVGAPEMNLDEADAIWQPLVWQGKRFPKHSVLTLEDASPMPVAMVERRGITTGVIADPQAIPYRLPSLEKGAVKFGLLIRNEKGKVQPTLFSPVLGTNESILKSGEHYRFKLKILVNRGTILDTHPYIAEKILGFKDYRKNIFCNLNQTITNMTSYVMNDGLVNFNPDLRGFDYSTDVLLTVKNVSPLHPLSVAMITDDRDVYERRAKPMIEYGLSREKYLFTRNKDVNGQGASGKMTGPGIEVSELAILHSMFGQKTPLFNYLADSMLSVKRQLNINTISDGRSFINLLELYKTTKDRSILKQAIDRADLYIKGLHKEMSELSNASAQFFTDYAPLWMELLDLFEVTKEERFLEAAAYGAKIYLQYVWFYPVIPDSNIRINSGNIVGYKGFYSPDKGIYAKVRLMESSEQEVPAWRVSQIGLHPEATNTVTENTAIFLAHFAPHLLRLAYYTHNDFYRSVARSAVVGRYSNYPGYDINGIFTTIYERPDYPHRPLNEVTYNQLYYNHVFPNIALLYDYLLSDVFAKSLGHIDFPHRFSPGYAYLKSNVYGFEPGRFYTDSNVNLWMPANILKIDNEQINYMTGYGNGKFYVSLLNQSDDEQEVTIRMNPNLIPYNNGQYYTTNIWVENKRLQDQNCKDGIVRFRMGAKGICAFAVDGINILTSFQKEVNNAEVKEMGSDSYRFFQTPFGKVSSTILCLGKELSEIYIWLEAGSPQLEGAKLEYQLNGKEEWNCMEDSEFPYEFRIPLNDTMMNVQLRLTGFGEIGGNKEIANWQLKKF